VLLYKKMNISTKSFIVNDFPIPVLVNRNPPIREENTQKVSVKDENTTQNTILPKIDYVLK